MADLTFRAALLVATGAALGGLARWGVGAFLTRDFPYGTVAVNVAGSFVLAWALFAGLSRGWLGPDARLFFAIGFLGAFTTMSTFAYETIAMLEAGDRARAAWNFVANPLMSLGAAWMGRVVALSTGGA